MQLILSIVLAVAAAAPQNYRVPYGVKNEAKIKEIQIQWEQFLEYLPWLHGPPGPPGTPGYNKVIYASAIAGPGMDDLR